MKIVKVVDIISKGDFIASQDFAKVLDDVKKAIGKVVWDDNNTTFTINPTLKGNGVNPIKNKFVGHLKSLKWTAEGRIALINGLNPGPIDALIETPHGKFAVEWETGNISSTHRALNKIALGILQNALIGGILVLPTRALAKYLTDRIGNYEEIEPYIQFYRAFNVDHAYLAIIAVEHDATSDTVPLIPKGKDGNAKKDEKLVI